VALSIPLVLAAVFVVMSFSGIDLQRISLGALIIALGLLVDDAMITVESMVTRLEHGDDRNTPPSSPTPRTAFPMLTGTLVTVAGSSYWLRAQCRGRVHVLDFRRRRHCADYLLDCRSPLFALARRLDSQEAEDRPLGRARPILSVFRRFLVLAMRARWVTILLTLGLFGLALFGMRFVPQQFFPSSIGPSCS
jgi:multidrug efflux pump subunit AcrB